LRPGADPEGKVNTVLYSNREHGADTGTAENGKIDR